jgi:hypothetical protein
MREKEKELRRRRRNEKARKRRFARKVYSSWSWWGTNTDKNREWVEQMVRSNADNMQACSCSMCGNPRRCLYAKGEHRLTMQERKFSELCDEELFDN